MYKRLARPPAFLKPKVKTAKPNSCEKARLTRMCAGNPWLRSRQRSGDTGLACRGHVRSRPKARSMQNVREQE